KMIAGSLLASLLLLTVSACSPALNGETNGEIKGEINGEIQVYVTDAPPKQEVTSIMVAVSEVKVHLAEAGTVATESNTDTEITEDVISEDITATEEEAGGEWITIALDEAASTFDLLKIEGIEQFLGSSGVPVGKYTQVRLVVDTVQVALNEGKLQDASVPSNELKIVRPFNVIEGETTVLVLDFIADRMVTVTGTGKIMVKPVIKLSVRQGKEKPQNTEPNGNLKLEDGTWILQSYGDPVNPKAVLEGTLIFADFDEDTGQVTGNAGANSYFGSYNLEGENLTIPGPIGATEMYRMDPEGVMDQEQEYLSLLQQSKAYSITGDILNITCDNQILIFRYTTGLKPAP
ncbi:DUF4382 domain-containing protein, partial [Chloroflexota bacterium]